MNMLDMHTREKVNKLHIAQMHQEARSRHLLHGFNPTRSTVILRGGGGLVLLVAILVLLAGALLIFAAVTFDVAAVVRAI